jgi:hypothetical protein
MTSPKKGLLKEEAKRKASSQGTVTQTLKLMWLIFA